MLFQRAFPTAFPFYNIVHKASGMLSPYMALCLNSAGVFYFPGISVEAATKASKVLRETT